MQVFITAAVLNGSSCHEHRASVQRQLTLIGSCLTVKCRAHVLAISTDVSGRQIYSKWLTICHSFKPPSPAPPGSLSPSPSPFMSLPVYASLSQLPFFWSSPSNPSSALTHSFHLYLVAGACREGFGLLSGGSESSFLLRAVSEAVPQTPGV